MTLGQVRWRRGGLGRSRISATASAVARVRREGGKGRLGGDLAADDVQGAGEREPAGVYFGLVGGFGQEPVELLQDQVRGAGAEDDGGAALVGLDLVEGELYFPALVIGGGQVGGRGVLVAEDAGDEGDDLAAAAGDVVVDDADGHAGQVGEGAGAGGELVRLVLRLGDVAAVGAVGQPFQDGQVDLGLDADAEVRPGGGDRGDHLVAVEAAVRGDEHAGLQVPRLGGQGPGERDLAGTGGARFRGGDGAGAALGQRHDQDPRERRRPVLAAAAAEVLRVGGGVGDVQLEAVDGHQPAAAQPGPRPWSAARTDERPARTARAAARCPAARGPGRGRTRSARAIPFSRPPARKGPAPASA